MNALVLEDVGEAVAAAVPAAPDDVARGVGVAADTETEGVRIVVLSVPGGGAGVRDANPHEREQVLGQGSGIDDEEVGAGLIRPSVAGLRECCRSGANEKEKDGHRQHASNSSLREHGNHS
jgi:hypothetical protein